uniref:citron Rho-interacting kinase isoform X2 n=1 Tax=Myxine glutinosa TaxID=7769 RepID=UPI00358F69EE
MHRRHELLFAMHNSKLETNSSTIQPVMNTISSRLLRLNQTVQGRGVQPHQLRYLATRDGLLDSLLVLFDECSRPGLMANDYVESFIEKYSEMVSELRELRPHVADFEECAVIGRSQHSYVKVVRERASGDVFAMKVRCKETMMKRPRNRYRICFEEERDVMAQGSSPWLVQLQYSFQDSENLYLVMRFHPGGDLQYLRAQYEDQFDETTVCFYLAELVLALHSLHQMGYVHRNVQAKKVLIDRTGHIKLTGFGCAVQMSRGTSVNGRGGAAEAEWPLYMAPEALESPEAASCPEVDWWALGVVAYEMVYGETPFSGKTPTITRSNILSYQSPLHLPDHPFVSMEFADLLHGLLCNRDERLDYKQLICHPFFSGVDWSTIRQTPPPFVPTLLGDDDTSNCEEMGHEQGLAALWSPSQLRPPGFSGRELPFIGYSYSRALPSLTCSNSVMSALDSPAKQKAIEKKLQIKTKELQDAQDRCHKMTQELEGQHRKVGELEETLQHRNNEVKSLEKERGVLERDLAMYITECNGLKRNLEQARLEVSRDDDHALELLMDIREQNAKLQAIQQQEFQAQLEELQSSVHCLEDDLCSALCRADQAENDLRKAHAALDNSRRRLADCQEKLTKAREHTKNEVSDLQVQLGKVKADSQTKIVEMQEKLSKAVHASEEATELLENVRHSKEQLESQMQNVREQQGSCQVILLRRRLEEKEERCQNLESHVHRLEGVKHHKAKLKDELQEKSTQMRQMVEKIMELEERCRLAETSSRRLDGHVKQQGKLYQDKIRALEVQLQLDLAEKESLEQSRVHHEQDTIDKSKLIEDQKTMIKALESRLRTLEQHITELSEANKMVANSSLFTQRNMRAQEETSADLRQQKLYLETQVGKAEARIQQLEERLQQSWQGASGARQSVLSLEAKLREASMALEQAHAEGRKETTDLSLAMQERDRQLEAERQRRADLEERLVKLQKDLEKTTAEAEEEIASLTASREGIQKKFDTLRESCSVVTEMEKQLAELSQENASLSRQNVMLSKQLEELKGMNERERRCAASDIAALREELTTRDVTISKHELTMNMLKMTCTELEQQIGDLETLNADLAAREHCSEEQRSAAEEERNCKAQRLHEMQHFLEAEKQARLRAEQKAVEARRAVDLAVREHKAETTALQSSAKEHRLKAENLSETLSNLEKKQALLELGAKGLQQKLETERQLKQKLIQEQAKLQQRLDSHKTQVHRLSQSLQDTLDQVDLLKTERADMENQIENLQAICENERVKMEGTITQQSKLIDFLQVKLDQPAKKKKGLFGRKGKEGLLQQGLAASYGDLHTALEHEKARTTDLEESLQKVRLELKASQEEVIQLKNADSQASNGSSGSQQQLIISALVRSPVHQASGALSLLAPPSHRKQSATPDGHHLKERMHHNIPHRFGIGLNMRATKCAICLDTVHFGRQAAKCVECQVMSHPKCSQCLPATCGLPAEYASHFADVLCRERLNSPGLHPSQPAHTPRLQAWMKLPRSGRQSALGWDCKFIVLENSKLKIFDSDNFEGSPPVDEFELVLPDGDVMVHGAVSPAELPNMAKTDVAYVLKLEFRPHMSCWPGRSTYLLAPSFPDKQRWVAALEAVVSGGHRAQERADADAKLLGNSLLKLEGDDRLDINCTLPLTDQIVLVGAEEGLYTLNVAKSALTHVPAVGSVFQVHVVKELDQLVMIVGEERALCVLDIKKVKQSLAQAHLPAQPEVKPVPLENIAGCHLFAVGKIENTPCICAAVPNQVCMLRYNRGLGMFCLRKEVETSEPCSCILFTPYSVIFGTNKFYEIDLKQYSLEEFLDKTDQSLASALFASSYHSFPVAIIQIAGGSGALVPEEYLLCFHEFAIFVDAYGRRSRTEDLKWSRLPLAFAYREPFLFVTHFNSLEVIELNNSKVNTATSPTRTFLGLPSPRYLGPAVSPGAIYMASSYQNKLRIVCCKGNLIREGDKPRSNTASSPTKRGPPSYTEHMAKRRAGSPARSVEDSSSSEHSSRAHSQPPLRGFNGRLKDGGSPGRGLDNGGEDGIRGWPCAFRRERSPGRAREPGLPRPDRRRDPSRGRPTQPRRDISPSSWGSEKKRDKSVSRPPSAERAAKMPAGAGRGPTQADRGKANPHLASSDEQRTQ